MTDDDRRLADRLRRYESRVPLDADAPITIRPRAAVPWGALAGVAVVLVLAVLVGANLLARQRAVGEASPAATTSGEARPSPDDRILAPIEAVDVQDDGRLLVLDFLGSPSACVEYRAEVGGDADVLDVTIVGSRRPLPSDAECPAAGEVRRLGVSLEPSFSGTQVRDLVSGRTFPVEVALPTATAAPSASPATPTTTAAPTPVTRVAGVEWATRPASTIDEGVSMITSHAGRLYALGSVPDGFLSTGAIWSSTDGTSWERVLLPRPQGSDDLLVGATGLVSADERLVAIGALFRDDYAETVVWESSDGMTWFEVDSAGLRQAGVGPVDASDGPGGIVLTTGRYIPTEDSAWRSMDGGETWTEHRPAGEHLILGPIVGTRQGYVLGGAIAEDEWAENTHPAIWTSPDGADWRAALVEGTDGQGTVTHVTVDGSGTWVAIGTLNSRTVAWRSTDLKRWTVTADLAPADVRWSSGFRLIGAPGGFIAFHATEPAVTWTSEDGLRWSSREDSLMGTLAEPSDIGWAPGIARIGDRLVVLGGSLDADGWRAWIGEIRR